MSEQARDQALTELDSGSCIDHIVWEYLHDDVVVDENNEVQRVYKGIAQGFAVSPFLANYILRDVDEAISKLDVLYYRYFPAFWRKASMVNKTIVLSRACIRDTLLLK